MVWDISSMRTSCSHVAISSIPAPSEHMPSQSVPGCFDKLRMLREAMAWAACVSFYPNRKLMPVKSVSRDHASEEGSITDEQMSRVNSVSMCSPCHTLVWSQDSRPPNTSKILFTKKPNLKTAVSLGFPLYVGLSRIYLDSSIYYVYYVTWILLPPF